MRKKVLLKIVSVFIFILGIKSKVYCPLFGNINPIVVTFANSIPWEPEIIEEWKTKVMQPLKKFGDTTPLESLDYKTQKDRIDGNIQIAIDGTKNLQKKDYYTSLKKKIDEIYTSLNAKNAQHVLSVDKEHYIPRYYLIDLEKEFAGQRYFELELRPGERKEVRLPVKGPIVQIYRFENKQAEEFFKKHGFHKYLASHFGHELGLQKFFYDAIKERQFAEEAIFPEPPSSRRKSLFDMECEEAGGKSIPMKTFVGEDSSTLTRPLLATGRE